MERCWKVETPEFVGRLLPFAPCTAYKNLITHFQKREKIIYQQPFVYGDWWPMMMVLIWCNSRAMLSRSQHLNRIHVSLHSNPQHNSSFHINNLYFDSCVVSVRLINLARSSALMLPPSTVECHTIIVRTIVLSTAITKKTQRKQKQLNEVRTWSRFVFFLISLDLFYRFTLQLWPLNHNVHKPFAAIFPYKY